MDILAPSGCDDGFKVCTKCKSTKPFSEYGKHSMGAGGLRPSCKECRKIEHKEYLQKNGDKKRAANALYRQKNKEKIKISDALYRLNNKEKEIARGKKWREENPEKERARSKLYRENHKEKDALRKSIYAKANRDVMRSISARRRAREKSAIGSHSAADIKQLLILQNMKCAVCLCDVSVKNHVDHIVPLALGGGNDRHNLQLLCPTCNFSKSCKDPIDFMQQQGFLL
jgi:5-methylcytosine-specific restriction endonuclease McrA